MKKLIALLLGVTLSICLQAAELPVALGAASTFTVLGGSGTVSSTGFTVVSGDVGLSPGSAVVGFPPASIVPGTGAIHINDSAAVLAQAALMVAYLDAAGRSTAPVTVAGNLDGRILPAGLYKAQTTLGLGPGGVLTLQGDANSVFIFQIGSGLTMDSGSQVILQGGVQAANIFWQVGSSATLGTYSNFSGTIMALASVTLNTGAALNGRALARISVTLDSNTMVNPGPPTTGETPPPALAVTCPVSAAQIGVTYNSLLVATGGTPPYTYSITTGSLPPGLSLNTSTGAVTGTPTGAGTNSFAANALDSAERTANRSCSITATSAPVVPPPVPAPSSLILVLIGFACTALYCSRERVLRLVGRS